MEFVLQTLGYLGVLAVGYAAIRADLARLHEKASNAKESADSAHKRIDVMLGRAHG